MDATPDNSTPLPGSERQPPPGATRVGDIDPNETLDVSVILNRQASAAPSAAGGDLGTSLESRQAARTAFAATYGASDEALQQVATFAAAAGLEIVTSDAARRTVVLRGTADAMQTAFGVELARYQYKASTDTFRGREGHAHVPAALAPYVTAVLGLDNRTQAHAHFKTGETISEDDLPSPADGAGHRLSPMAAGGPPPAPTPLWASVVGQLYEFPTQSAAGSPLDGSGQTIGIIELGGGYRQEDLGAYFAKAGILEPTVAAIDVGTGSNSPGGDADGEVLLDIEVSGSVAPGAAIAVYFAEGADDRGFLDALTTAIHDQTHAPSVISISWGGPEDSWTPQGISAFNDALQDAAALGVTVTVAAGDHGVADGTNDGKRHADFPATSPYALACGGTTLVAADDGIVSEVVWNDQSGWASGGGFSTVFARPDYQKGVKAPKTRGTATSGRGVPDVAGNADVDSGYLIRVDGKWSPIGGTSAVAPLWAGLVARLNQARGTSAGHLNPAIYAFGTPSAVFRDIVVGNNSVPIDPDGKVLKGYTASVGWDACSGLGAAQGKHLLAALSTANAAPAAVLPPTP